jgi:DNA polymerase-3 subunit alpha (Gram-positive type)
MEKVRRGKGVSPEHEQLMRENGVPEWYIESCKKIRYMFPKAHAAAYTISSLRIAWFKVYYPEEYYCAYFTVRADEFDSKRMCLPAAEIHRSREKLRAGFREAPDREQKIFYILELVEEMQLRGIEFLPIDLYESAATQFVKVEPNRIRPPLKAIPSISAGIAESIVRARANGPFQSRDDLMRRAGIGQSAVETLAEAGCLAGLPESSQIDLFEFMG